MLKIIKSFWGNPSPMCIAASVALGVMLGICPSGSAAWLIILGLCLILKTHILSLLVGFVTGNLLDIALSSLYEPTGKMILLSNKILWQAVLSKPVICYLNLYVGKVMGNLFISILCGLIIFIILLLTLNNILPKLKARKSI